MDKNDKEIKITDEVDKVILALCSRVNTELGSANIFASGDYVANLVNSLANLVDVRAKLGANAAVADITDTIKSKLIEIINNETADYEFEP